MTGMDYTGDYGLYAGPAEYLSSSATAVDWEKGHHSFKFGATGILRNMEYFRPIAGKGFFDFANGDFTGYADLRDAGGLHGLRTTIGAQSGLLQQHQL